MLTCSTYPQARRDLRNIAVTSPLPSLPIAPLHALPALRIASLRDQDPPQLVDPVRRFPTSPASLPHALVRVVPTKLERMAVRLHRCMLLTVCAGFSAAACGQPGPCARRGCIMGVAERRALRKDGELGIERS